MTRAQVLAWVLIASVVALGLGIAVHAHVQAFAALAMYA